MTKRPVDVTIRVYDDKHSTVTVDADEYQHMAGFAFFGALRRKPDGEIAALGADVTVVALGPPIIYIGTFMGRAAASRAIVIAIKADQTCEFSLWGDAGGLVTARQHLLARTEAITQIRAEIDGMSDRPGAYFSVEPVGYCELSDENPLDYSDGATEAPDITPVDFTEIEKSVAKAAASGELLVDDPDEPADASEVWEGTDADVAARAHEEAALNEDEAAEREGA